MADISATEPGTIVAEERDAAPPRDGEAHRDLGTRTLAIGVSVVATIIGLIILAWAVLYVTKGRFLKHTFERIASRMSGREVKVAGDFNFYFDPIATKFLAEGLTVSNPKWASTPNFWESKLVDARIATLSLIFGEKRRVNWINLQDATINLEWDTKHQRNSWTFRDPNRPPEPFELPLIQRAEVAGTTLRYRDPQMRIRADIDFQTVRANDNRVANAIRFTGRGTARGTPFTLQGSQTSPNALIAGGRNRFELHAQGARSFVDISGTLPGATVIEGADLSVAVRGQNLQDLFAVAGIAVPDTRAYRLRSHFTKRGQDYRFTRLTGSYGNSDLRGGFTVRVPRAGTDGRMFVSAELRSKLVDIVDIGPFIGYNPDVLATRGAVAATAASAESGNGGIPRILPDAPLRVDMLKNFDARVDYRIADIKQPFVPISNVVLGLELDRMLLKLSPLNFDIAGGKLESDISINARVPAIVTDYDIRLSPTPMGKLLARFGVDDAGTTGTVKARVQMKGTGNTVRDSLATSNGRIAVILPKGTFWTKYIQLSEFDVGTFITKMFEKKLKDPVQINCGLIGFTVRNGIATADPILIDTTKNVMTAKGGFSFKDESLSLAFRADAKKFSLFSGQSPVGIGGYFARPSIQIITPELLARGGAGAVLAAAVNPLAGMLAFVDFGDAKAAACGPILAGARATAQRTTKGEPRKDVGTGKNRDIKAEKKDRVGA